MACRPPPLLLLRPLLASPIPAGGLRSSHRLFSTAAAADPANTTQIYISRSRDPLLNLSLEHHLLQTASPSATVLMLYANAPCVVFGRNQNPWIEADLARLARQGVQLVRRRSGGGTVFHDEGNVNFSVACPSAAFDRDRHAEMVARALRRLGRPSARVNARHDIVVDVDAGLAAASATFKVSGSAYKLTRRRSLHHGTCLLRSPNLASISGLLRAPAAPFVRARGVDSVRSPVRNLELDAEAFRDAVVREFEGLYGGPPRLRAVVEHDAAMAVEEVRRGYEEMRTREWVYGQTPRFAFATHPTELDPRPRPELPFKERVHFEAKQGVIERFEMEDGNGVEREISSLVGTNVHDVGDWSAQLADAGVASQQAQYIGDWLNGILGTKFTRP